MSSIKHVGVLGMKWGRRKNPQQSEHKSRVKSLKKRISEADLKNFNRASKIITKKEKEMNDNLDRLQAKKLSEIDNSKSMGAVRKFLAKAAVKYDISTRRDDIVGQLEDKYHFSPDAKRSKARNKAEIEIIANADKEMDRLITELSKKKLPFLQDIKEVARIEREVTNKMREDILKSALEIEERNFDD